MDKLKGGRTAIAGDSEMQKMLARPELFRDDMVIRRVLSRQESESLRIEGDRERLRGCQEKSKTLGAGLCSTLLQSPLQ